MGFVYWIASPSEYLAITGRYGINDGVKLAKKAWIAPGQGCMRFDISPVNYKFEVHAMSTEKLPFILATVFTIGPRADGKECLRRYAKFIISPSTHDNVDNLSHHHVKELVKGVIEGGETLALAASMTMDEIFRGTGTEEFKEAVFENVQLELNQFGLIIYNSELAMKKDGWEQQARVAEVGAAKHYQNDGLLLVFSISNKILPLAKTLGNPH